MPKATLKSQRTLVISIPELWAVIAERFDLPAPSGESVPSMHDSETQANAVEFIYTDDREMEA